MTGRGLPRLIGMLAARNSRAAGAPRLRHLLWPVGHSPFLTFSLNDAFTDEAAKSVYLDAIFTKSCDDEVRKEAMYRQWARIKHRHPIDLRRVQGCMFGFDDTRRIKMRFVRNISCPEQARHDV